MTRDELLNANFTQDQLDEIQLGIKDGVDVSVYANEELLAIQMRQIRLGLLSGVRVSSYNKPEFDWFQMEEIRIGLENHIDTDKYADPSIPYMKMRQVRKGLMLGIDLTGQLDKKPDVLRQIRKALVAGVDISKYVAEGYNAGQLTEIRKGLEQGLDIEEYLDIEYRGGSIREICKGLASGIDVNIYAEEDYSWRQMREIRLGLENQLDVSIYSNPFFQWREMRQIRLGLLAGIDVTSYAKLSFTYREMTKRREAIENAAFNLGIDDLGDEIGDVQGGVTVAVIEYGMKAVMNCPEGSLYTKKAVDEALKNSNVTFGIIQDNIDKAIGFRSNGEPIVIARGVEPIEGKDGRYEFFFDTNPTRAPKELDDGFLDFVNVNWYETVKKDDKLATYYPATEGRNGQSVTGVVLNTRNGAELKVLTGKGIRKSEDGHDYYADATGIIEYDEDKGSINISDCLDVDEVNNATGAVKFEGNVHIHGNVGMGAIINSTGDIIVDGFVEACFMETGGNIVLKNGANGKGGKSLIKAGGEISGKFFENMKLEADVGIIANYCLHCDIYTKGTLDLSARKGLLLGGYTVVEERIKVNNVGNNLGTPTKIVVGMNDRIREIGKDVQQQMKTVRGEIKILRNACEQFQAKYSPEERNTMDMYLKIENAIYTKELQLKDLKERKAEYTERIKEMMRAKVDIRNNLYEGVRFDFNGRIWNSEKNYNITMTRDANNIVIVKN